MMMDENNEYQSALDRMRIAIVSQGCYGSDGDNELNRQDIQLYALASIAESLAKIAEAVNPPHSSGDYSTYPAYIRTRPIEEY
jgi:hypothetical protein